MIQHDRDWFRPLWRRLLVTGFIAVWCLWEWFWNKDQFWSLLTAAMLAYAVWSFFIAFDRRGGGGGGSGDPPPDSSQS